MSRWDPLPPGRGERWLVRNRAQVHLGLVFVTVVLIAVGLRTDFVTYSLAALVLGWVPVVEIYVRRTRRWDAEHSDP